MALIPVAAGATTADELVALLHIIDEELTAPEQPIPGPHPLAGPDGHCRMAEVETFFDRNLAYHSLKKLVELPANGVIDEREGYESAVLAVPQSDWTTCSDAVTCGRSFDITVAPYGSIVTGWYHIFADGSIAAIAITNASVADGGAFVDFFLIIQAGAYPDAPNPSLPPTQRLDEDFTLQHPDGTHRVIRLVPAST